MNVKYPVLSVIAWILETNEINLVCAFLVNWNNTRANYTTWYWYLTKTDQKKIWHASITRYISLFICSIKVFKKNQRRMFHSIHTKYNLWEIIVSTCRAYPYHIHQLCERTLLSITNSKPIVNASHVRNLHEKSEKGSIFKDSTCNKLWLQHKQGGSITWTNDQGHQSRNLNVSSSRNVELFPNMLETVFSNIKTEDALNICRWKLWIKVWIENS